MINKCQIGGRPFLSREFHQNVCIGRPLVDAISAANARPHWILYLFLDCSNHSGLAADPPKGGGFSKLTEFCSRMYYLLCASNAQNEYYKQLFKWDISTQTSYNQQTRFKKTQHTVVSCFSSKRHFFNFSYIHIRDQMHYNIIIL